MNTACFHVTFTYLVVSLLLVFQERQILLAYKFLTVGNVKHIPWSFFKVWQVMFYIL